MYRYYLIILFLCLGNTVYAESVENEQALSIIYDTKIAGIGFNSSVEDIKNALSQHEIPMDCEYTERLVAPKTKLNKKTKKDAFYQSWGCKYVEGMKYKMLDVRTVNGIVFYILYRGSIPSSLDKKDMFSYYREIDKKLSATGVVHDDYNFVFEDIGPDVSPAYIQQRLRMHLLTRCHGGLTSVVFEEKLTEMTAQKAFTIEVKYERQSCP
ncbi:MAG: hypothetical protein COB23_00685 [Methylophaga sp.]|nr:MAG: hypothetical protein COB23_00685 [Methylophaga sp.]